jgi:NitT/TauT family transport system permease protein/sulfonate transport system permease protein
MNVKNKNFKVYEFLAGVFSIGLFIAIWFVGTNGTELGRLIPTPDKVFLAFIKAIFGKIGRYGLIVHIIWSLSRIVIGFCLASACGIVLGLAMGWSKTVEAIFQPLFGIIRPIPPIAWIPISIIWFGLGENAKYFLIFLAAFSNVTLNAWAGAKAVDPQLIGAAQMLGANKVQIFFTIVMPSSVPQIFAGLQIAMSSSWATVVAAEMVRSSEGVGWIIVTGMNNNDIIQILVGIMAIGIVGFALAVIMRKLEGILCRWNKSGR